MVKKKVLVHGNLNTLQEFFNSPFNRTYEVEAVLIENTVTTPILTGGGAKLKFSSRKTCPNLFLILLTA